MFLQRADNISTYYYLWLLSAADTPPPAYSPSEDIKQNDNAMDTSSGTLVASNVTPIQYQVGYLLQRFTCRKL